MSIINTWPYMVAQAVEEKKHTLPVYIASQSYTWKFGSWSCPRTWHMLKIDGNCAEKYKSQRESKDRSGLKKLLRSISFGAATEDVQIEAIRVIKLRDGVEVQVLICSNIYCD